jgi:hypothetical protein
MAREKVEVHIPGGRTVTVIADCRYKGTDIGPSGSANLEVYDVVINGVTCRGTWNNNARCRTQVYAPPEELLQFLRNKESQARSHRKRAEYLAMTREDQALADECEAFERQFS